MISEEEIEKIKKQYDANMESAIRALGEKALECEIAKDEIKRLNGMLMNYENEVGRIAQFLSPETK